MKKKFQQLNPFIISIVLLYATCFNIIIIESNKKTNKKQSL